VRTRKQAGYLFALYAGGRSTRGYRRRRTGSMTERSQTEFLVPTLILETR